METQNKIYNLKRFLATGLLAIGLPIVVNGQGTLEHITATGLRAAAQKNARNGDYSKAQGQANAANLMDILGNAGDAGYIADKNKEAEIEAAKIRADAERDAARIRAGANENVNNEDIQEVETARQTQDYYVVQKGDTLSLIAQRYKTNIGGLIKANNIIGNQIRSGQKLIIPSDYSETSKLVAKTKNIAKEPIPTSITLQPYIVQDKETIEDVSMKFTVRVLDLKLINQLTNDQINAGQKLLIPYLK